MKKRRYRRLFAVLTAAMFSACNVSTALAMPLQELTEDYQDFNTKLVEESRKSLEEKQALVGRLLQELELLA